MGDVQTPSEPKAGFVDGEPIGKADWRMPYTAQDFRDEIRRVKRKRVRNVVLIVILALIVALVLVAVLVFKVPSSLHTVGTDGMQPELSKGQIVYVQPDKDPAAGEVLFFADSTGAEQVKRVAATSGQWVNVASDGSVVISETPLEGNSAAGVINGDAYIVGSRQVPEGYLFMKGDADQATASMLSEADSFISESQVIGRAELKIWPLF